MKNTIFNAVNSFSKTWMLLLIIFIITLQSSFAQNKESKPNIILIMADDLGFETIHFHDIVPFAASSICSSTRRVTSLNLSLTPAAVRIISFLFITSTYGIHKQHCGQNAKPNT